MLANMFVTSQLWLMAKLNLVYIFFFIFFRIHSISEVKTQHYLKLFRVRNLKFATHLKFATCENTNKINELWGDLLTV